MPRYDIPKAAEGPLRLVQRFVNTADHEHGRELLATPEALHGWFADQGIAAGRVTRNDLARAHELREALRSLLRANNGSELGAHAVDVVNRSARDARLGAELQPDGRVELLPVGEGAVAALGQIVAVMFDAILDGSWPRLKACRNCGWSFYDYSKNRSASWCSMQICGNRQKTRAYRRRKATGGRA